MEGFKEECRTTVEKRVMCCLKRWKFWLAGEEQEVLAFKEESNHGAEDEEVCLEMRTPAFPDRLTCYFSLSHYHMTNYAYHYVSRWKTL